MEVVVEVVVVVVEIVVLVVEVVMVGLVAEIGRDIHINSYCLWDADVIFSLPSGRPIK